MSVIAEIKFKYLLNKSYFRICTGAKVRIGKNVKICNSRIIVTSGSHMEIGDNVCIENSIISVVNGICTICNNFNISSCLIWWTCKICKTRSNTKSQPVLIYTTCFPFSIHQQIIDMKNCVLPIPGGPERIVSDCERIELPRKLSNLQYHKMIK